MSSSTERMRRLRARRKRGVEDRPWREIRLENLAERLKERLALKAKRK